MNMDSYFIWSTVYNIFNNNTVKYCNKSTLHFMCNSKKDKYAATQMFEEKYKE